MPSRVLPKLGPQNRAQFAALSGEAVLPAIHPRQWPRKVESMTAQQVAGNIVCLEAVCNHRFPSGSLEENRDQLLARLRVRRHPRAEVIGKGSLSAKNITVQLTASPYRHS